MQRNAVLPAGCQGMHARICLEGVVPEAAEETHHRQVELAVTSVCSRVDEPTHAVAVQQAVARPEVTMQSRRRLICARNLREVVRNIVQCSNLIRPEYARGLGHPRERPKASLPVEFRPGRGRVVGQRSASGRSPILAAETGGARPVQCRELLAEGGLGASTEPGLWRLVDPSQNQEGKRPVGAIVDPEHLGNCQRAGVAQPLQSAGLSREEPRRCARMCLGEDDRAVGHVDSVRQCNVTTAERTLIAHVTTERATHRACEFVEHGFEASGAPFARSGGEASCARHRSTLRCEPRIWGYVMARASSAQGQARSSHAAVLVLLLLSSILVAPMHTADATSATALRSTEACAPGWPPRFTDVTDSHEFCNAIEWLAAQGLTGGFPDGTYRPASALTRQAMAAFLHRLAGSPSFTPPANPTFSDVPSTHIFHTSIEWLAASGITLGYGDGTFRPTATLTRQAMAAFLYRANASPPFVPAASPRFTDVGATHPFRLEIEWLAATGATIGYPDGSFGARTAMSRQALAAFLYRLVATIVWQGPAGAETVAVLGDSIVTLNYAGDEIAADLSDAGYRHATRAQGGHRWDQRKEAADAFTTADPHANQVVINLGSNDAVQIGNGTWTIEQSLAAIDEILSLFATATCIHLVTVHTATANTGLNQWAAVLNDEYEQRAMLDSRIRTVPWDATLAMHDPATLLLDDVHPNQAGQDLLRDLILTSVAGCTDA